MKFLRLIKGADYLSNEVKLTINKHDTRLKTFVGGLLSIISIIIMISFGISFFVQFIQQTELYVTMSTDSSDYTNITESNSFPFLMRLTDKSNRPFANPGSIYKISLKYWYGGSNTTQEVVQQQTIDIDIEQCDITKHFSHYVSLFKDMNDLDTFYCAVPRPDNMTMYGKYGGVNPFGYYHFYVSFCADRSDCLSMSDLTKTTENVYLDFRTVGFSINSLEKNPKVPRIQADRHMISSTVYKRIWLYYNQVTYVTDSGFFLSSQSTELFSQYDSMRYDIDMRDINTGTIPGTFVTMTILNTGEVLLYNRKYLKVQDYLATIGGIFKFVDIIAMLLNYTFAKNSYNLKLINELHILQSITKEDKDSHLISVIKKLNPLKKTSNTNKITNMLCNNTDVKNEANDSKDQLDVSKFKKKVIVMEKMNKWYYRFIPLQCFTSKATNIFYKCIDKLNCCMNIVNILMKLEDNSLLMKEVLGSDKFLYHTKQLNSPLNNIMINHQNDKGVYFK